MPNITQGDSTSAFGNHFLKIYTSIPEGQTVSKAVFVSGSVKKTITDITDPIILDLTSEETAQLKCGRNVAYLIAYDENDQPITCQGKLEFNVEPRKG
jgi:hypothetical protein